MSMPEPSDNLLTTIKAHLNAADAALTELDPGNPGNASEQALRELRSASTAHERYVRGISHDLRNTLTLISGQVQLLERMMAKDRLDPDRLRRSLAAITQSVVEANAIIRRLSGS